MTYRTASFVCMVVIFGILGISIWTPSPTPPPRAECAVSAAEQRAYALHNRETLERIERRVEALELLITQELSEDCQ